jgi:hypothetical protein
VAASDRILVGAALALAFAAAGCRPPPKPQRFQDTLAQDTNKLLMTARPFRRDVMALARGEQPSAPALQLGLDNMRKALNDAKANAASLSAPAGSSSGRAYLNEYKEFLKGQDTVLQKMEQIAALAQGPGDPADKLAQVEAMFREAAAEETRSREGLEKAQGDFASEHNLALVQEFSDKKK